jgi:HTH-type transcriptional regulator, global nitrogen regulator NrpRI
MFGLDNQEVRRKVSAILQILRDSNEPQGARVIAQKLKNHGVELGERAVRYHLKMTDERGLTRLIGRDGRLITDRGIEELKSAMVRDKVGFAISRIDLLAFRTNFDLDKHTGLVPVNISFFPKDKFGDALRAMKPAFDSGLCVSEMVATAREGERFGEIIVPPDKVALATVCSVVLNGILLKSGVPMDSRFGGVLEMKDRTPLRFVELIHYAGSSLDPSEVFICAGMTTVAVTAKNGTGKIVANYREIPAICKPIFDNAVQKLKNAGIGGILTVGHTSEPVCEIPVELNRIGIVVMGGLNPVAAAHEAGVQTESHAMSTVMEYSNLMKISDLI